MPTTQTTRQRNDEIRDRASQPFAQDVTYLANYYGLSPITVRNILRGRDLNPPPSARNRRPARARADSRGSSRRSGSQASQPLGFQRRFGVEIEFTGVARHRVEDALRNLPGWRVKSDISVDVGRGLELVSPPLRGEEGLQSVRDACALLRDLGARVDQSCGLHVHHEANDLGAEGIARVAESYQANWDLIGWLVAPSRRANCRWAMPSSPHELNTARDYARQGRVWGQSRYRALNVQSYTRHGTVEFRQHQGTLNARKIEAWIHLGQGLMDAGLTASRVSASGIRGLLDQTVADEDNRAFLLGRALQLGSPAHLVSA